MWSVVFGRNIIFNCTKKKRYLCICRKRREILWFHLAINAHNKENRQIDCTIFLVLSLSRSISIILVGFKKNFSDCFVRVTMETMNQTANLDVYNCFGFVSLHQHQHHHTSGSVDFSSVFGMWMKSSMIYCIILD